MPRPRALYGAIQARAGDTAFLGYETTTAEGRVVAIVRDGMEFDELTGHGEAEVVLDQTPFYAEGGGQVGDQGVAPRAGRRERAVHGRPTRRSRSAASSSTAARSTAGSASARPVEARRRCRTARPHDAQPHGDAPAPSGAAQRRRRAGTPGGLAGDARLPALRLPVRPGPDPRRAARHRGRGPSHHPRGPARLHRVHEHGRGDRGWRRRLLRREVRRDGPDHPGRGLQLRAVRRDALPGDRPDRRLPDHRRAQHRLRDAPHRGRHRAPPPMRSSASASTSSSGPPTPLGAQSTERDRRARSPRSRTSCARRSGGSRPGSGPVCPSPASWPRPRRRWRPASASSPRPWPTNRWTRSRLRPGTSAACSVRGSSRSGSTPTSRSCS